MFTEWEKLKIFYAEITSELSQEHLEQKRRTALQKKASHVSAVLSQYDEVEKTKQALQQAQAQVSEQKDPEFKDLFMQEVKDLQERLIVHEKALEEVLYPVDELADRDAYLEIRAGTGGQEAALFAGDLAKMYMHYADKKGWKVEISSESKTDLGGYKEIVLFIKGKNVFGSLRGESGGHRVQRVPATETAGRVHTSTVTVAVMPEAQEVDITINPNDLRIDVYRSSGAGGQHVNTTDSAVRVTHIPTGVVVACQDGRSQHKNKEMALKELRSRLLAHQEEQRHAEQSKMRKDQVGTGVRAEKNRTYNYPQNRVTDHQVDLTLKKLDMVMMGDLDEIVEALQSKARQDRQQQVSIFDLEI